MNSFERGQELIFSTVDTTVVMPGAPNTETPYKRVIGLEFGGLTLHAVDIYHPRYSGLPIDQFSVQTTKRFGGRLFGFYKKHFTERGSIETPGCFDFTAWMDGVELPIGEGYDYVAGIRVDGEEAGLHRPQGRHLVVAPKVPKDSAPLALHSVISLGESGDQCVQVMGQSMFSRLMGIDSFQNVLAYYQNLPGNLGSELGFFASPSK